MSIFPVRKVLTVAAVTVAGLLLIRYLGPVLMPFFLGTLIALGAEPAVKLGVRKFHISRTLSSGIGVTVTLLLFSATLYLTGALAVKELGQLVGVIPNVQETVGQGLSLLQDWLIGIADRAPDGFRTLLTRLVLELFGSSSAFLSQLTGRLPGMLSNLLGWIPNGAVSLITGILAGFMISVRLPRIRGFLKQRIPERWRAQYFPALKKLRKTLGSWLRAQLKLMGVTYGIVGAGLFLFGVSYGLVWAVPIAIVDAVPILGTGTVLIPWAVIALLQGKTFLAVGLLVTYGAAMLTRTVLEPRLLGKQLGLDPLVTLLFFYAGYKLFGILGMLLAPMVAAAAKSLTSDN